MEVIIYSDGASRGNPGRSAIAFQIMTKDGKLLKKNSRYIGIRTNNQAEYEALISALRSASTLTDQKVTCYLDSEVIVNHLKGRYKVRNSELKTLWSKVQELKHGFSEITFTHVSRTNTHIKETDRLVNEALDMAKK